jgi:ABC-type phosphate transport system permease subunit
VAIYVSQYAPRRVREVVKPAVELLAGIPSVVLGFFALMVMATWFQDYLGLESRLSALVAGVALSFAIIPVIFTISEEAIGAVPRSYVEASLALGAAKWQTIVKVVLPAASPGIAAGVALGLGRAVGETMIVLMASGNAAIVSGSFADSVRTLSATIAAELAEVVVGGAHYTALFFIGTLLLSSPPSPSTCSATTPSPHEAQAGGGLVKKRTRLGDLALTVATASATVLVLAILVVIFVDIGVHGAPRLSLGFIFHEPTNGMTAGGIFPALFGTWRWWC